MRQAKLTEVLKDAISLAEAARRVPRNPHVGTIWRWSTQGCRGIKLRTWLAGGIRVTTPAAVEEFLQELNSSADASPSEARRLAQQAGAALEDLGA